MATKTADIVTAGTSDEVKHFSYKARNSDGKVVMGTAQALSRGDLINELLRRNLVPQAVKGGESGAGLGTEISLRKGAKKRDLVIVTRQLASMLDAGLTVLEAIDIVRTDCEDPLLASGLNELRVAVQNGSPLSAALAAQGDLFPPMVINFVTAGEEGGDIKSAMNRVADQLDAEDKLRAKIKKAMAYPAVVFVISMIVFGFMMLFLVPQFTNTFIEIGGPGTKLPMLTQLVVHVSSVSTYALPAFLLLSVPSFLWYRANKNKPAVRQFVDPRKLKLPVFGTLFHKIALARFARNLSGLLEAGVERLAALEIAANTVGNIDMERAVLEARDAQRRGEALVTPLKAEPLFPNMLIQFVEVGEKSGSTAFMLSKAADLYERDVDTISDNMAALIEPLFLVGLGAMVGTIVVAIYLPYLSINEMIE